MSPERIVLGVMGVGLLAYTLGGGADFGGGLWDLLASGPRKHRQRELIEHAIAPIWEANHVWLIFVVVLMFTVFPRAFAAIATALHIPIVIALIGIVLRGSAFTFRAYGLEPSERRRRWQHVFAWSSVVTPLFLGMTLAGISSGAIELVAGRVVSGFLVGWTSPFAVSVGLFVVALFALLAAVYLTLDALREGDDALANDFRRRAVMTEIGAGVLAMIVLWRAARDAPLLFTNLVEAPWSIPVQIATAVVAGAVIAALLTGRERWARALVVVQVALVVVGWGLAMQGHLLLPALHYSGAGARGEVTRPLLYALAAGSVLLLPSLFVLFRVFKRRRR